MDIVHPLHRSLPSTFKGDVLLAAFPLHRYTVIPLHRSLPSDVQWAFVFFVSFVVKKNLGGLDIVHPLHRSMPSASACGRQVQGDVLLAAFPLHRYTVIPLHRSLPSDVQGAFVFFVFFVVKKILVVWTLSIRYTVHCLRRSRGRSLGCLPVTPLYRYTVTPFIAFGVQGDVLLAAFPLHRYTVIPLHRYTVIPLHR